MNQTHHRSSGGAESRTRVQRKHDRAFYMLISQLDCRAIGRTGNPPRRWPYLLRFRLTSEELRLASLKGYDVRHAVY